MRTQPVKMIPPNTTLLKYDNPMLVTKNTEKKTPVVRNEYTTTTADRWAVV